MILPQEYYKTSEVMDAFHILSARGRYWFLNCIKTGKLKATNTNPNGFPPRYLIKGEEILRFVKKLEDAQ